MCGSLSLSLSLILIAILSLVSCQISVTTPTAEVKGDVSFNFDLSGAKAAGYNITRVHVKLTHQDAGIVKEQDLTVDSDNNRAYGTITGLRIGTWDVLAELYENDTEVGSGTSQVTIEAGKMAEVHIKINLNTGSANVVVEWGEEIPLYYWIQDQEKIWIKSSWSNENELYVYYGVTSGNPKNDWEDGNKVFELWDDFRKFDGWEVYGVEPSTTVVDDNIVLEMSGWSEIVHELNISTVTNTIGYAFESRSKVLSGMEAFMPFFGFGTSDRYGDEDNAYQFGYNVGFSKLDNIRIIKNEIWEVSKTGSIDFSKRTAWAEVTFTVCGSTLTQIVNDSEKGSETIYVKDTGFWLGKIPHEVGIIVWNSVTYAIDWMFVRKCSSNIPSIVYKPEETGTWNIDGYTFTKRRKVIVNSEEALENFQIALDYSKFNDNNLLIVKIK